MLIRDLNTAGLINSGLDGMATAAGVYQSATTSMGRAFIAFISDRDRR